MAQYPRPEADPVAIAALASYQPLSAKGAAGGYAALDGSGKIVVGSLPALSITSTTTVASQAAQLALSAQEGDVAVRTDESKTYIHNGGSTGTMGDWTLLATPVDSVLSVAGKTGAVTLAASDVGAAPTVHTHAQADVTGLVTTLEGKQPLNAGLTSISGLTTTSFGRSLLTQADAAASRTTIGAAATSHTHAESDITGLAADLEGKASSASVTSLTSRVALIDNGTDWSAGKNIVMYAAGIAGRKVHLRDGTDEAPVITVNPTLKVSRREELTVAAIEAAGGAGTDGADQVAALAGLSEGGAASETQTVGLYGGAKNASNSESGNPDASGGYLIGRITGGSSAKATAIGATIVGRRDVSTADISGAEISANNATLVAGTYSSTGASRTRVLWLYMSGTAGGGAIINIGNPANVQAEVAIGIPNQNGGPASNSTFRDDGEAKRSIDIRGAHSEGAIIVGAASGPVILGASSLTTTTTQKLEINVGSTASMPALRLQANANTSLGLRMNNTSANFDLGQSGGAGQLMTGTVAGDGVIIIGNSNTLHIGRSAATAVLKIGSGLGFYGHAVAERTEAYVQTYSAVTREAKNVTSAEVVTTGSTSTTPFGYTTGAQANAIPTAINALRVDLGNVKQLLNSVIDDFQANGMFQ